MPVPRPAQMDPCAGAVELPLQKSLSLLRFLRPIHHILGLVLDNRQSVRCAYRISSRSLSDGLMISILRSVLLIGYVAISPLHIATTSLLGHISLGHSHF